MKCRQNPRSFFFSHTGEFGSKDFLYHFCVIFGQFRRKSRIFKVSTNLPPPIILFYMFVLILRVIPATSSTMKLPTTVIAFVLFYIGMAGAIPMRTGGFSPKAFHYTLLTTPLISFFGHSQKNKPIISQPKRRQAPIIIVALNQSIIRPATS